MAAAARAAVEEGFDSAKQTKALIALLNDLLAVTPPASTRR